MGVVFWLALWLVFLILTRTMGLGYGAAIFGFAIGYPAVLLGGMTLIARRWGEATIGPWIVFGAAMLIPLVRRFLGAFPGTRP